MTELTEWRVLPEFPKYEVTEDGDVRNRETKEILTETENQKTGAYAYSLRRANGKHTTRHYQGLIYSAFPELEPPKPEPKVKRVVSKKGDWKIIPDFPRYQVHKDGRVRYTGNRNAIAPKMDHTEHVFLSNEKGRFRKTIDRLVREVWVSEQEAA